MFRKLFFMLFTLACFIGAGVCLIVDIAIHRQVVWSVYPLLSIAFGWLIFSPLLLKKHGLVISMAAASLLSPVFLYLLNKITPGGDWFLPLGLPSAAVGAAALWVFYVLFRFAKINPWYKAAVIVFLSGAVIGPVINHFADLYLGTPTDTLNLAINLFSGVVAAAFLAIRGYAADQRKKQRKQGDQA